MNRPASARPGTASGRTVGSASSRGRQGGGARPMTSFGRPPSAMGKPPPQQDTPTAGRPITAAAGGRGRLGTAAGPPRTGMARPGTRSGAAAGPLGLSQRPVTQQGLQGVRPGTTRGVRQVQDKSYFMSLLRGKMTELASEISKLNANIDQHSRENQNQLSYEKRAESLAHEIKGLQGELADYNMLIDKMTVNANFNEIQLEYEELKQVNEVESKTVDQLFAQRRQKEEEVKQLEIDLDNERIASEQLMNNTDTRIKEKFDDLKQQHQQTIEELQLKENELQELSMKKVELEEDLAMSQIKQEAMILHEHLAQLETQRDIILAEVNAQGTPEQQREKLLEKVKQDNQEISAMERQTAEAKERMEQIQIESRELEQDFEDQQGQNNQKYKELRQKEQQMDEFLDSFEQNRSDESVKIEQLESAIVRMMTIITKNITKYATTTGLGDSSSSSMEKPRSDPKEEYQRLQGELQRLSGMEVMMKEEQISLMERIGKLTEDIAVFSNINQLRLDVEQKKENLTAEQEQLSGKVDNVKERAKLLGQEVGRLRQNLNENEIATQISNLEKKLQHVEQNNFAVKEMIESRNAETNPGPVKEAVLQLVAEYNQLLIRNVMKGPAGAGRVSSG